MADPFVELRNSLRIDELKKYTTDELTAELQRRKEVHMEERITMSEGDVDDYTHNPHDETRREVIYRDDSIQVAVLDEKGAGGAHHLYETCMNRGQYRALTRTRFQKGAVHAEGSNGTTNEAELAKVKHRLECFQDGEFPCDENDEALHHINKAMEALARRTANRKTRGVADTHQK